MKPFCSPFAGSAPHPFGTGGLRARRLMKSALFALLIGAFASCGDDTSVIPGFNADANNGDDVNGFPEDVVLAKDSTSVEYDIQFGDGDVNPLFDATGDSVDGGDAVTTTTACETDVDCVDVSSPCTPSVCVDKLCQPAAELPNGATCEDGDACTTLQTCQDGQCQGGVAQNCDDGNPCSQDQCDLNHGCQHALVNGGACEDGNACTVGDTCQSGTCTPAGSLDCDDKNPCTADTCDALSGCVHAVMDGSACDDGNVCTIGDACVGDVCTPGKGKVCDDGNACTTDGCDLSGDCTTAFNSAPCDDGNACSKDDICTIGACGGTGFSCDDGSICTTDSCDPEKGCVYTPTTLPCDDKNPCTASDTCANGACVGLALQAAQICDDLNPCTTESCDAITGCQYALNTAPCEDGNLCTSGDTCFNGVCNSGVSSCACTNDVECQQYEDNDLCNGKLFCDQTGAQSLCKVNPMSVVTCDGGADSACSQNQCEKSTGKCQYVQTNEGLACDADGTICTTSDSCKGGNCVPGPLLNCDDTNPCTTDSCDPKTGCIFAPSSAACSDGNACTVGDVCKDSACASGPITQCDDENPCTDDACDQASAKCLFVLNTLACDDGNACSLNDTCVGGVCSGTSAVCDDKNPCTSDSCDPTKSCVNSPNTVPCDDGNACTTGDVCGGGACKGQSSGTGVVCDDGNPCTTDACDPTSGCTHTANVSACDDGNPCTAGDVCAATKCVSGTNTCSCGSDADCAGQEDANLCNGTLYCDKSAAPYNCKVNPKTIITCDTTNDTTCLHNQCDPQVGKCANAPANEGQACNADGSVCTTTDVCKAGACSQGSALVCDDGNPCSDDVCDPKSGCAHTANSAACSDGNPCTTGDTCSQNACVTGSGTNCNDSNPCTTDACDPTTGKCIFQNNNLPCNDGNACSQADACQNGVCAGSGISCDDGNPCTNDSCASASGCVHTFNSVTCDDSNACTSNDVCTSGACKGTAVSAAVQCDDANPCTTDACNPSTGCSHANNSATCDDGNSCTAGDTCAVGKCVSGTNTCGCTADSECAGQEDGNFCNGTLYCDKAALPYNCKVNPKTVVTCDASADTTCTKNTCATATGKCAYQSQNNSQPCDADGSVCTVGDVCVNGVCSAGTALACDDGNLCTDDSCDKVSGCVHKANASPCTDGNACTVGDQCVSSGCVPGAVKACSDGNVCTSDSCDKASGNCLFANNTLSCDDGNACSANDVCAGGICGGSALNCNDNNVCTTDSCNPTKGCVNAVNTLTCNDNNACTQNDLCSSGACAGTAVSVAVLCDDGNPCTTESCVPSTGCAHANNAVSCDDGNPCTSGDVCAAGTCKSGTNTCGCATNADCAGQENGNACDGTLFCDKAALPYSCKVNPATIVTCDASADTACTKNTCATATGKCSYVNQNEAGPCNADNSVCTAPDICTAGVCKAGASLNCNDTNPCTNDSCSTTLGCQHVNNTSPCTDGNACTVGDSCATGACKPGAVAVCNDSNACTTDSCNTLTGACVYANNAITCNDGNACSQNDVCANGTCGGVNVNCDDSNICTSDSCSPVTGCAHTNNALSCNDGNACTTNDACAGGACTGTAVIVATFCDDGKICTNDACNPLSGCTHVNNTSTCDDGNGCTVGDVCAAGVCTSGANSCGCTQNSECAAQEDGNLCNGTLFCDTAALPYSCKVNPSTVVNCDTAGNGVCTLNTCAPATGTCSYIAQNQGAQCNADNSVCSVGDACNAGVCLPGPQVNCNDNNACTDDSCNPATGCTHTANASPCTDNNACTVGDVCSASGCVPGAVKNCNDSNPCTLDTCDTVSGNCVFSNSTATCDDGNACTSADKCTAGACVGTAITCNDGNTCTDDACIAATGCKYTANTVPCNDGNACTTGDTCSGGLCSSTGTVNCNDANPCTTDVCNSATGCQNNANAAICDDGNACTNGDVCANKACAGAGITCNDNNLCTTDSCNPGTGCVFAVNNLACNDNNACTTGDVCGAGTCKGNVVSPTVLCDDGKACTTDACDPVAGCTHSNNILSCDDGNPCTIGDVCSGGACTSGSNNCGCKTTADCAGQEDGNACNGTLYCDVATLPYSCKVNPATIVTCSAAGDNTCRKNTCATATGVCSYVAQNAGSLCDADGSVCTNPDVCTGANCVAGSALNCDDGNACTNDSCNPTTGCTHTANTSTCSDGNACTNGDKCTGGACVSGPSTTCADGNACTVDSCNTLTGVCVFNGPGANGASCDADGSVCTSGDFCNNSVCTPGGALNCNDSNACTDDSCNGTTGCSHTANNAPCNDGNLCTGPDVCTGGVCAPPAINCDDSNACTTDSCVLGIGCQHIALPDKSSCGAVNVCFTGVCKLGVCGDGVLQVALGEACDDGNKVSGDGCSATCVVEDTACADGSREGAMDKVRYPNIAQCSGNWYGSIASSSGTGSAQLLCGVNFHVCNSSAADQALEQSITQADAFQQGCWSLNAANDNGTCHACTNTADTNDAAGVGALCQGKITNYGVSCISGNYRIDSMNQTCVRPQGQYPWINGVMCCHN